jgi:hypothetical protein
LKIERYWGDAESNTAIDIKTGSIRRISAKTSARWAAEPAGRRPYGLRPYKLKRAQALASAILAPVITDTQRIRDLRVHIHEQRRESGAAFQDGHSSPAEFARGVRWAELEAIDQWRRHDQRRRFIDVLDGPADYENAPGFKIIRPIKYGRPHKQPGRKPKGECAMTTAERVRNHRARKKSA